MPFGYAKTSKLNVSNQSEALRALADLSRRSVAHPLIKTTSHLITRKCPPRDEMCELTAILQAVRHHSWLTPEGAPGGDPDVPGLVYGVRYVHDPVLFDSFTAPYLLLAEGVEANRGGGAPSGDCLPGDTLLLTKGYKFTPISDVSVGDVVMGDGKWVTITQKWNKGVQNILELKLGNGCVLRCTPEHKVFRAPLGERAHAEEIRAGEIKPGDDLMTAEKQNPIYRTADNNRFANVKVKSIAEGEPAETFDIEVEGHRFYLPETDLIVHNCDDMSALIAALCAAVGFSVMLRAWGPPGEDFQHVFPVASLPKADTRPANMRTWYALDATVERAYVGWEPPPGNVLNAIVAGATR